MSGVPRATAPRRLGVAALLAAVLCSTGCGGERATATLRDPEPAAAVVREAAPANNARTEPATALARPPAVVKRVGLHVVGNRLLDGRNRPVKLRGVNRSGAEYACVQGWGMFDGPMDEASVRALASWRVNVVRLMLNETCWLGINGVKPEYSGARYRNAIVRYVRLLRRHGMYAHLSLAWGAPGDYQATYQSGAPDADHAPAAWTSLAATFKNNPNVILGPWGETVVNPDCFLNGGVCEATYGPENTPYKTAGMQEAVTRMRRAGFRGVIAIPGVNYANDLSHWLSHRPRDPLRQLIAEAHIYGNNACGTPECFDRTIAPVARRFPVVFGETGPSYDDSDCGSSAIARIMSWADRHGVGYEAWTWATWGTCNSLISSYDGTPLNDYGRWVRSHYRQRG